MQPCLKIIYSITDATFELEKVGGSCNLVYVTWLPFLLLSLRIRLKFPRSFILSCVVRRRQASSLNRNLGRVIMKIEAQEILPFNGFRNISHLLSQETAK